VLGSIYHPSRIPRFCSGITADIIFRCSFYSGPLRGIFANLKRHNLLGDVQTLILDGLSVTSELCHEIILEPAFNVRVLSLRGTKHLNERKLCRSLQYACRPSRPVGTPKLKALYVFGSPEQPAGRTEDDWYQKRGRMTTGSLSDDWAATLVDCHGVIAFDALPCNGPRHLNSPAYGKIEASHLVTPMGAPHDTQWAVASFSVSGCAGCGAAPEGITTHAGTPPSQLPLLAPPPLMSSSLKACTTPSECSKSGSFVARCFDCLRDRYCSCCHKWWCEDCYTPPTAPVFHRSLSTSDVVIVSPDGDAWIQHHEAADNAVAKPKVWRHLCLDTCGGDRM